MNKKFIQVLKKDYPEFCFKLGKKFAFRPPKTIILGPDEPYYELLSLHELSHAILKHRDYNLDVERLKMENAAWGKAKELANHYRIKIDEDLIQDQLDTYRNWLHQKSEAVLRKDLEMELKRRANIFFPHILGAVSDKLSAQKVKTQLLKITY